MKKTIIALSVLLVGIVPYGFSQNKTITGIITSSEDKQPMPGVSIKITGVKSGGTQTNAEGEYSFEIPQEAQSLTFTMISYIPQEVTIGTKTKIDVVLVADKKVLEEVMVMGYSVQNKKDVTSAVSTIKGSDLTDLSIQSFDQGLLGRVPGLNVTIFNGVLNNFLVICVRGYNSINNNFSPLIILDGVPVFTGNIGNTNAANNPLGDISSFDIEDNYILKDAAATAVYGSRAANGVLVIFTKLGKKGKNTVRYNSSMGFTRVYNVPDILNAKQYMEIKNEARKNANLIFVEAFFPSFNADGSEVDNYWPDLIYRTGTSSTNNLSLFGAIDLIFYYFSVGIIDQNGMIRNNCF